MNKFIVFALIAAVSCNDLIEGPEGGKKIYDENKEASPAIWKRNDEVTIKTNDTDVIRRIVIKDLRPEKDGEAQIVNGGPGQKNVTLMLKSPTIFRGYDFHIEVYVVAENGEEIANSDVTTEVSYPEEVPVFTEQIAVMENDTKVNAKDKPATKSDNSKVEDREVFSGQEKVPIITDKKTNTDIVDPVAQFVTTEKAIAKPSDHLPNHPQHQERKIREVKETAAPRTDLAKHQTETTVTPTIHGQKEGTTTEKRVQATENEDELKLFRNISKELGERVVFGVKKRE